MLFQDIQSPVPQRMEGQERRKKPRMGGRCLRGNHTMSFLGVPRDEGIWFPMVTTCWSRGHTELLDPFIPRQVRVGVSSVLSLSDSDGLSVSQSNYERPHEALQDPLNPPCLCSCQ